MLNCKILIYFLIAHVKICSSIKISKNVHYSTSLHNLYQNVEKTWLFINEFDDSALNIIKNELLSQLKKFSLDKSEFTYASSQLDKIAHKISDRIFKKKIKFKLKSLFILEEVTDSSFFVDFFSSFKENPVVYSIWNLKSGLIPSRSELVLEIQYRFPITLRGVPTFYFSPIVTYKANVNTGNNVDSRFSNETILLDTDPLIPWKTHKIGRFNMYPPLIKFAFNVQ